MTVPKRGYRFVASVRKVAAAAAAEPGAAVSPRAWRWRGAALLGVAAVLVLGVAYSYIGHPGRMASRAPTMPIRSLAVLPLENLSRDPEQEYFADGMTDELITQLARISALRVISRTSVMRFKGTRKPLAEIARELNVDAVVEGTIVRSAQRVRVTAQVIQASPEQHLWVERYERPLGDIVVLQGELAREISQAIRIKLTPQEQTRLADVRPVNQEAYEALLKGRYYWSKRTEEATKKAIEYFQQAIERDPTSALAFTGLADSYVSLALTEALQEVLPPREAFPKARAAANRALEIEQCRKALDMDSSFALAHYRLGQIHVLKGMNGEAIPELEKAIALSGGSPRATAELGLAHARLGNRGEALRLLEALKERSRRRYVSPFNMAVIYGGIGDKGRALEWLERAYEERSPSLSHLQLSPAFASLHSEPRFTELVRRVGLPPQS